MTTLNRHEQATIDRLAELRWRRETGAGRVTDAQLDYRHAWRSWGILARVCSSPPLAQRLGKS